MIIFPGHHTAAARHFQKVFSNIFDSKIKLNKARELVAAMCSDTDAITSWNHLCARLKAGVPVQVDGFTESFKQKAELIFGTTIEQYDEPQLVLENVLRHYNFDMVPRPDEDLESPRVSYGRHRCILSDCLGNTEDLARVIRKLEHVKGRKEQPTPSEMPDLGYFDQEPIEDVVDVWLFERFGDSLPDNLSGEQYDNLYQQFESKLRTSEERQNIVDALYLSHDDEEICRRSTEMPLLQSFLAVRNSSDRRPVIFERLPDDSIVGIWHCYIGHAYDDRVVEWNNNVSDRVVFFYLWESGRWTPIGASSGYTVTAPHINELLDVGDFHSAMGNDMAKAVLEYVAVQKEKAYAVLLQYPLSVTLVYPQVVLAESVLRFCESEEAGQESVDNFKAEMMSWVPEAFVPVIIGPLPDCSEEAEFDDPDIFGQQFQALGINSFKESAAVLMEVEGPKSTSTVMNPFDIWSFNHTPDNEREPMTDEVRQSMASARSMAERLKRQLPSGLTFLTYDPWDYPNT